MWFLEVIGAGVIIAIVFIGGVLQGESQEREHQRNKRRLERMGGMSNENKYWR
ncbi:hypothetical protein [Leuconostoc mesenteroides]|uniref:hypothetical protein n=1 Tax=Leuconostoc mesenteroides TaxID=1245 RepID=UPI002361D714|nr:hypothetical protein [Leuconostoc mesenteroides]